MSDALVIVGCLLLSGCLSAVGSSPGESKTASLAASTAHNETQPDNAPHALPVKIDAALNTSALACTYTRTPLDDVACDETPDAPDWWHEMGKANLSEADLTLFWNATSPGTQRLDFLLLFDNGTAHPHVLCPWQEGTSPLRIACKVREHDPNATLGLIVQPANLLTSPAIVWASTGQPFHIEGTLTMNNNTIR